MLQTQITFPLNMMRNELVNNEGLIIKQASFIDRN